MSKIKAYKTANYLDLPEAAEAYSGESVRGGNGKLAGKTVAALKEAERGEGETHTGNTAAVFKSITER